MANNVSSAYAWSAYKNNEKKNPGKFKYSQKKPEFKYDGRDAERYYKELLNRKDFSFDLNGSALYDQYKDKFTKQGQLAMMDTIGQASDMTGGYGNSYAASAGAQAYQQNLDKLNEVVPDIYNLALQQYQLEGQNLLDKYGVATDKKQEAYSEYRDTLSDYYTDRDYAYGQHRYSVADYEANRNFLYGVYENARDYEYQQQRDTVADNQWAEELAQQQRRYAEEMAYQRERDSVQDSQWAQELAEQQRQYDASLAEEKRQYNGDNDITEGGTTFKLSGDGDSGTTVTLNKNQEQLLDYFSDYFTKLGVENNSREKKAALDNWHNAKRIDDETYKIMCEIFIDD